ncbi:MULTISPECIES: peptidylprolyl isomerase [unclassified Acidisoma]|uniref:peptidylprolyl isomerase n=1 Tax=unclassified Acidisoma TaxID=2634065 RepID=UPI00131DBE71|nr:MULTISPECIES: peptidylprolyl isomerase [unclassified Acidisoma]
MLALLRRSLNTWPARILFIVLVASFAVWGVGDVVRNLGNDGSAARVGSTRISPQAADQAFRQQIQQTAQQLGGPDQITPPMRMMIAEQATARLVAQAAIDQMAQRLGLAAPDAALRTEVYGMDVFQDAQHQFNRARFDQVLQQNGMTEGEFLDLMRAQLMRNQLLNTVRASATAPATMVRTAYAIQNEARIVRFVTLPFSAAPPPPTPTPAELQRWYRNHPQDFSAPEYRHIAVAVLSPDAVARGITVSDADIRPLYQQASAAQTKVETRSINAVVASDEATAKRLAATWSAGADWDAMQKAASAAGANAIQLPDTTAAQVPSPEIADAAFEAAANVVSAPIHTGSGWAVIEVTGIKPGGAPGFESMAPALRQQVARERAVALVEQRVNAFQDALAGGTPLDKLPGDLGLVGLQGSVDTNGISPEGQPVPIPGAAALRAAVVAQAFKQGVNQKAALINGPDHSYFALVVDGITPAAQRDFLAVQPQVLAAWTHAAIRREQETVAAGLLGAMQSGRTLQGAASPLNLTVQTSGPITHNGALPPGIPQNLVTPLFGLTVGESSMVETPDGFVVAVLDSIQRPDPSKDPVGYDQLKTQLSGTVSSDMQAIFAGAVTARANPHVNQAVIQQIAQP